MHEMSLAESVVCIAEDAAQREGASRVRAVLLDIGQLSHVAPEALAFCFDAVAAGTIVAGARLEIRRLAGSGICRSCGASQAMSEIYAVCDSCGSTALEPTAGTEMRVRAIDL